MLKLFPMRKAGAGRTDDMSAKRTIWWRGLAGALAVAGCVASPAKAETDTVDEVVWTYTVADGRASVGSGEWNGSAVSKSLSGPLVVPSVLGGHPVTAIGAYAFQGCANLTEVTIPDSVTDIGLESFWECSSLTNVSIPASVTNIDRMAFYGCASLLSAAIPEGVKIINNSLFEFCGVLREVSIPSTVTYVGRESFAGCSNLTALALPATVTWIAGGAFHHCGLAALYVPEEWENPEELFFQAELPSGCPLVRYDATGETRTAESPAPVPHAWLALKAASALAANGSDFEAAARATAANGREMWECYVAGLDPTVRDRNFMAVISIAGGQPKLESVDPDLGAERRYTLLGKRNLMDDTWDDMETVPVAEKGEYRFFCVGVSLPE
jgi:hypothetical protein